MKYIFVFAVMFLFAVCVWGQNINEKTGLPEGYAIWFMNAECGETRYFEKENLIGISLSDTGNWSLTYKPVDVQPGSDWTVYAVAGGRGIGVLNGGGVSVGGFLSDKDQGVDWGPASWRGGEMSLELMSCDIHIPENATKLTPQVAGHGGGEIFVYAIEAVKKGEKPSLSVPHTVLPVWNDTKPISVPLDQEEKYGVKGIYLPGEEGVFRVGRLGIGCKELKYIITDLFGNKADEGITAYGQEIKFVPKKAGYYEISLSGEGIYGENITKKLVGSSSCIFVSAPKKFTPWGNPFGGQSPNSLDMYERLNITWDKFICYNLDTGSHSEMPTDYEDYKNKVAEKVRSGILGKYHTKGVEIWNEPENEIPGVYQKWDELAKTAKATTEGIHSVSPETKTMFDICHLGNLTKYHEAGGVGTYDVLSLHPYCPALYNEPKYPQPPEEGGIISMLLAAREQLDREGMAEAEIWTTEYGWTTGSLSQGASLEEQAKYMVRSSVLQLACGVKRVNPFRLTDVPFWGEMDGKFGFIRDDRTPKPVLATYSIMAQTVDDNPYIGQIDMGDNIGAFVFGKTGKTVLVLWKFGGEAEVNVPIKQNSILRDMFGNDMPFKGGNVTAGENPQYLIFNLSPKSVYSKIKGKFIKGGIEDIFVAKNDKIKIPEYTVYFMKDISLADDWNVQPVRVSSEKRFENDIPNEAEVKFVTDGKNIFVSYKVTGEEILPLNTKDYNMTWNGAGMEIFITLDENVRSNNKRKCDFQLCLNPGKGGEIVDIWSETDGRIPGSEVVCKPIENGYEMKAKIPVSYLNRYSEQDKELKFGDRLRLDWVVNIADEKGDRHGMLSTHSGSFSTDPSVWGKTVIK